MTETRAYSQDLTNFMGELELRASQQQNRFRRYMIFEDANPPAQLTKEEKSIAFEYLLRRRSETRPSNIGCASGEAGEAD